MTLVITGAAHGLGRALAVEARANGNEVLAVDFDGEALAELNSPSLTLDLTAEDTAAQIAHAAPISGIIHCAGISGTGKFEDIPKSHHQKILNLNFEAPLKITCALLAAGAMDTKAVHAFVGSLSTFTGYPGAVSYAASKDGLASFARSLDKALPGGQRAACIFPGPMATEHAARYAPENSAKTVAARLDPNQAAKLILRDLDRGKRTIIPGAKARTLATLGRIAPGVMGRLLRHGLYEKMDQTRL